MLYNIYQKAEQLSQKYGNITAGFTIPEIGRIYTWGKHQHLLSNDNPPTEVELRELFDRYRRIQRGKDVVKSNTILIHYICDNKKKNVKLIFNQKLDNAYVIKTHAPRIGAFITFKRDNLIYFGWSLCMKTDSFDRHFAIAQAYDTAKVLVEPPKVPQSIKKYLGAALSRFERYWKTNLTNYPEP